LHEKRERKHNKITLNNLWQVDTRRQRLGIDGEEEQHGPVEMRETESDEEEKRKQWKRQKYN
jgi:hypothetical protein